ncbi:MAG: putative quinol monooxygenase [Gammaproteobacteria bacterium]
MDLFARFHARPGCGDALYRAILEVRGPTRQEPGCLDYQVFRSVRDQDEYCLHTRWRDQAAFEHHAGLPHTVRFVATVERLIDHGFHASLTERIDPKNPGRDSG